LAYCSECGSKLNAEAKLCDNCGVNLSEAAPEKTFERRQIDFGPVTNAAKLLTERIPILGNTKVQATIATVAIVLASFLYSDWRPDIGNFYAEQTDSENAAGPDFSTYEDEFLSERTEQRVTSAANVRNYPTSQNTDILENLSAGAMVSGRWVRGFDPTTRWLKLADRGYVWEGNLRQSNVAQPATVGDGNKKSRPVRVVGAYVPIKLSCRSASNATLLWFDGKQMGNGRGYIVEGEKLRFPATGRVSIGSSQYKFCSDPELPRVWRNSMPSLS